MRKAQLLLAVMLISVSLNGQSSYFGAGVGVGGSHGLGYAGSDKILESHAGAGFRLFSRLPVFADNRAKFTDSRKFGSVGGYTFRDDLSFLVRWRPVKRRPWPGCCGNVFFGPGVSVGHLESDRFAKTPVQFTAKVGYAFPDFAPFFMFRANEAFTLNKARNYVLGADLDFPLTPRFGWRVTPRFAVAHFRQGPGESVGYAFDLVVMPVWRRP